MSVKDVIRKSILNSDIYSTYDLGKIALSLIIALIMGMIIYFVYKKFYAGVVFSKSFAVTLIGMTVLTCMVTLAISTNIVISLGMVGALSIVRFRTAIKDPLDLLYLFWAITTGITVGAGMYWLTLASAVILIIMIVCFYAKASTGQVFVAVIHYEGTEAGDDIMKAFGKVKHYLKSKTLRAGTTELAVEVYVKNDEFSFEEEIRNISGVKDITLIQYNGEYNG
ncbi:DUF4956 domain-containing protein [Butyrivibrio sp. XB500-5]|uniref:DUF4956 domain-containing protein n=1 Tax=Butyrivibrio sp. XB500-5 TaxID=2364880 RepID=UPI000EAA061D|nr:DUF4956 domain-containing protein [Butyrivibrio sp. XB500-5]RKM62932.1 DUF4956 domain-containing protein [Butyrivibrio sp. XB500-5]